MAAPDVLNLPAQAAADAVFEGCTNRYQVSAFLVASRAEGLARGFGWGLVVGAVAAGALGLYAFTRRVEL